MEAVARFIGSVCIPPSAAWLGDFARFAYGAARWERESVTDRLVQAFEERVSKDKRHALFRSLDLRLVALWLWTMPKVDSDLAREPLGVLDYVKLGHRSRDVDLGTVTRFLRLTRQAQVNPERINAFCAGLDFKDLGERSHGVGLATVKNFLELARQAGVSTENLKAFGGGLDFKDLGQRYHGAGLATIWNFLRSPARQG